MHFKRFLSAIFYFFITFCKIWYFDGFWWEFLNFSVFYSRDKKFANNVKGNQILPSSFSSCTVVCNISNIGNKFERYERKTIGLKSCGTNKTPFFRRFLGENTPQLIFYYI